MLHFCFLNGGNMFFSKLIGKLSLFAFFIYSISTIAQDTEEVTVVGTQIKGASISSALPVSVYSIDDIEALGVDSGDELLDALTEQGQNQFAEASETGGINSSRGDIGAYNLNIGGNTLVLLMVVDWFLHQAIKTNQSVEVLPRFQQ